MSGGVKRSAEVSVKLPRIVAEPLASADRCAICRDGGALRSVGSPARESGRVLTFAVTLAECGEIHPPGPAAWLADSLDEMGGRGSRWNGTARENGFEEPW